VDSPSPPPPSAPAYGAPPPPPDPGPGRPEPAPWQPDRPDGGGAGWLANVREAKASWAFVAAAVVIFLLAWRESHIPLVGAVPLPDEVARKYGAYSWLDLRDNGEWWRFFSTLFVSRMALDALVYLVIFTSVGPQLERLLGTARFSILYLSAGAGGVALAELVDPISRQNGMGDTIVAVYACLGAIPGVVLGLTGSLLKTVKSPDTRGALSWIAFWTFFRYVAIQRLEPAVLGAAVLGLALGATLAWQKRRAVPGAAASVVPLVAIGILIGLVTHGLRLRDGKLLDRGRPATGQRPPVQPDAPGQETPAPSALTPPDASSAAVAEAREAVKPFLDQFGPLPPPEGYTLDQIEEARGHLVRLEKLVNGANTVTDELDPERVKLDIVTANYHEASRIAGDYLVSKPSPYARALAGLAAYAKRDLGRADDHLSTATGDAAFVVEVPEVRYYYARVLDDEGQHEAALAQYDMYLRAVRDGPYPPWRAPLVEAAKQAVGR
jgi:membrane associated rhomboid family serine protease